MERDLGQRTFSALMSLQKRRACRRILGLAFFARNSQKRAFPMYFWRPCDQEHDHYNSVQRYSSD